MQNAAAVDNSYIRQKISFQWFLFVLCFLSFECMRVYVCMCVFVYNSCVPNTFENGRELKHTSTDAKGNKLKRSWKSDEEALKDCF